MHEYDLLQFFEMMQLELKQLNSRHDYQGLGFDHQNHFSLQIFSKYIG